MNPKVPEEERKMGTELNQMTKIVFSSSLKEVTWENSILIRGEVAREVKKLKQDRGADMVIFGSGTIVQQLTAEGLIDEYLFAVTPTILGAGKTLFPGVKRSNLELLEARKFHSGNVLMHYKTK